MPILIVGYFSIIIPFLNIVESALLNIVFKIAKIISSFSLSKIYVPSLIAFIIFNFNFIPNEFVEIHFLDVGQGDSTLIITENHKTILIDGGERNGYDNGENVILPYLLTNGITKIDYMFCSHMDSDHEGGLEFILENLKVNNLILGLQFKENDNLKRIEEIVKNKDIDVKNVNSNSLIKIDESSNIEVLFPIKENMIIENAINNNSLVMKYNYYNTSILFTGDIEKQAENKLVKAYGNNLNADILKVAHHGANTSSTKSFLYSVKPKIALIGVGENNKFGHPHQEVLSNLEKMNIKVYRTDKNGEIILRIYIDGRIESKTCLE